MSEIPAHILPVLGELQHAWERMGKPAMVDVGSVASEITSLTYQSDGNVTVCVLGTLAHPDGLVTGWAKRHPGTRRVFVPSGKPVPDLAWILDVHGSRRYAKRTRSELIDPPNPERARQIALYRACRALLRHLKERRAK
mgnify:CR=1 FL=1